nr:insecticidal protein IPD102Ea [Pseudomonas putida]
MAISINIVAGPDEGVSSVSATGQEKHIITNGERTAFDIQDSSLKRAVAAYFGKAPNDAYLCSPTPWNDLYKSYDWDQVQTLLNVQSAKIIGDATVPTILNTNTFRNNSSVEAEFNCDVTQNVSVTSESNWSDTSSVEIGQEISYSIGFLGTGVEGSTSLNYTQSWQHGGSHSETLELGSSAGVKVTLKPGQAVKAELSASKGRLVIQIVYQVTLFGDTAINYNPTYKGHHFYGLNILGVMNSGNLPTTITTTETISIDYYSNVEVNVYDIENGSVLETYKLDVKRVAS